MFRIPETPGGIALEVVISLLANFVLISFFEHQIHKNLMHLKKLPKVLYKVVPHLNIVYSDHAVEHHGRFYKEFDYEPDEAGRHVNLLIRIQDTAFMGIGQVPLLALMIIFSPIAFVTFAFLGIMHNRIWGLVHVEMHIPSEKNFWKTWGVYRFLARHHFIHHMYPLRNFNVVYPFADFVLGSTAKPKLRHVKEMLRLGYLLPRSEASTRRVDALRARTSERRAQAEHAMMATEPAAPQAAVA